MNEELTDEEKAFELEEYRQELCTQVDFWGMDSLTEIQQCIVNGWEFVED